MHFLFDIPFYSDIPNPVDVIVIWIVSLESIGMILPNLRSQKCYLPGDRLSTSPPLLIKVLGFGVWDKHKRAEKPGTYVERTIEAIFEWKFDMGELSCHQLLPLKGLRGWRFVNNERNRHKREVNKWVHFLGRSWQERAVYPRFLP